jgi:type IV secretion system protein VirD4
VDVSTDVLISQIALAFAVAVLGLTAATQWTATAHGYQSGLGAWFVIFATPI